jgi:hypothetical protein
MALVPEDPQALASVIAGLQLVSLLFADLLRQRLIGEPAGHGRRGGLNPGLAAYRGDPLPRPLIFPVMVSL